MTNNENEIISNSSDQVGLTTVDDVTLAFMVNTAQYEKYLKKNNLAYDIPLAPNEPIQATGSNIAGAVDNDKAIDNVSSGENFHALSLTKNTDQRIDYKNKDSETKTFSIADETPVSLFL